MGSEILAVHYRSGRPVRLSLKRGRIETVSLIRGKTDGLPWVGPGLIDLQVNGFAGLDFNGARPSEETAGQIARELARVGVTTFCPTIITNSDETIEAAVRAVARGCGRDPVAGDAVAGIHLEGPFICPEDGARGAHAREHVRPPDWDLLERWRRAGEGRVRILTMSPEWPGSAAFIARGAASGLLVALGHTGAAPGQVREAAAAGARLSTHLGNGAHAQLPRHPNYLWEQMAEDRLWASVIADGFHLPDSVIKVILRAKGWHAVLVSDSVPQAGLPPGTYDTAACGRVVLEESGRLHLERDPGLLAGSAQPLVKGVERLLKVGICGFAEAWDRASTLPAELLGLPQADGLAAGAPADLVVFRWDGERIDVLRTLKKGKPVYEAGEDSSFSRPLKQS
jgi:N-acetylglucosamine-6-phosphate deacetylase